MVVVVPGPPRATPLCCTYHNPQDMGVLQELIDNNEAHFADAGGFVSPSGLVYIGASKKKLGQAAACAVKRINLDVRIARCAQRTGADLKEGFEVVDAVFDKSAGLWIVTSAKGDKVKARVLVCADGATSRLATKLGYCTEAPRGVCSRAFVEGGTHNTKFDGVCFYQRESLPGYSAIFKHPNDELNFCYYLIPTGKNVSTHRRTCAVRPARARISAAGPPRRPPVQAWPLDPMSRVVCRASAARSTSRTWPGCTTTPSRTTPSSPRPWAPTARSSG